MTLPFRRPLFTPLGANLPSGVLGSTLYNNGTAWVASTFLYNSGTLIGINTTTPSEILTLAGNLMLGAGATATSPTTRSILTPNGSGTNVATGGLTHGTGLATGNAAAGNHVWLGSTPGASGTAVQASLTLMTLNGSTGNLGIGGVASVGERLYVTGGSVILNATGSITERTEVRSSASVAGDGGLWLNQGSVNSYKFWTQGTGGTGSQLTIDYVTSATGAKLRAGILTLNDNGTVIIGDATGAAGTHARTLLITSVTGETGNAALELRKNPSVTTGSTGAIDFYNGSNNLGRIDFQPRSSDAAYGQLLGYVKYPNTAAPINVFSLFGLEFGVNPVASRMTLLDGGSSSQWIMQASNNADVETSYLRASAGGSNLIDLSTGATRFNLTSATLVNFLKLADPAGTGVPPVSGSVCILPYSRDNSDPTTSGIPDKCWGVWFAINTANPKIWLNDGGTLKSILFDPKLVNSTATGTGANTTETNLQTVTLKANTLSTSGGVEIYTAGTVTGANNTKDVKLYWGTTVIDTISFTTGETGDWDIQCIVFNDASASAQNIFRIVSRKGTTVVTSDIFKTSTENTAADVTIKTTGTTPNSADEITSEILLVKIIV